MKQASPSLDGKYTIIGRVINGIGVVDKLVYADRITNVTLKMPAK
jgi:cyclophilin family peptidyl-prolyl cis-trans isomerase